MNDHPYTADHAENQQSDYIRMDGNNSNTTGGFTHSPDQLEAIQRVFDFVNDGRSEFNFCGAAGTGKTTTLKWALEEAGLVPAELGPIYKALAIGMPPLKQEGSFVAAAHPLYLFNTKFTETYGVLPVRTNMRLAAERGVMLLPADYGNAITCHAVQGSERDIIAVKADLNMFRHRDMRMRWVYTALTRAKRRAYLYIPEMTGIEQWRAA